MFAGSETSLYGYAGNDSVNFLDPTGRDALMPYGAPGSSASIVQAAEAQEAGQQAQVQQAQRVASATKCVSNNFSSNFDYYKLPGQEEFGPIETLSSLDNVVKKAAEGGAVHIYAGVVNGAAADAASIGETGVAAGWSGLGSLIERGDEWAWIGGTGADLGDLIDSTYATASQGLQCCPQ